MDLYTLFILFLALFTGPCLILANRHNKQNHEVIYASPSLETNDYDPISSGDFRPFELRIQNNVQWSNDDGVFFECKDTQGWERNWKQIPKTYNGATYSYGFMGTMKSESYQFFCRVKATHELSGEEMVIENLNHYPFVHFGSVSMSDTPKELFFFNLNDDGFYDHRGEKIDELSWTWTSWTPAEK